MGDIKLFTYNIFGLGTPTITGTADSGYPESRLYDRAKCFYWQVTGTQATTFHVDQGATSILDVDALIIDGHNFDGEDITFEWSENDADWTAAVTGWTQSGSGQIVKTMATELAKRYWRLTLTSMTNPRCGELIVSGGYEFETLAAGGTKKRKVSNVRWNRTIGGVERGTLNGDRRREGSYPLLLDTTSLATLRTALDYLNELSKPFYIMDDEGDYWMCRLLNDPLEDIQYGHRAVDLNVIEVLG